MSISYKLIRLVGECEKFIEMYELQNKCENQCPAKESINRIKKTVNEIKQDDNFKRPAKIFDHRY